MKKKIKLLFILFMVFGLKFCYCQIANKSNGNKYLIVTYEVNRTKDDHGARDYHWIIPVDSIISSINKINQLPLYLDSYSNDNFKKCCANEDVYLFRFTTETNFEFEKEYENHQTRLKELISENKRKVQSYTKKWNYGNFKETVNVYLTSIYGDFCFCQNLGATNKESDVILLPNKNFNLNTLFWNSNKAKIILRNDFLDNYNFINKDKNI